MTIPQEAHLPHSARTIAFLNSEVICLAYEADHVLFSLDTMSTIEIASAPATIKSVAGIGNVGMGALSGLGGYMTLGLGSKLRPCVTNVGDAQVLVAKDSTYAGFLNRPVPNRPVAEGLFIGPDGKTSRKEHIPWPALPEDVSTSCEPAMSDRKVTPSCQALSNRTFSPSSLQEVCRQRPEVMQDQYRASQPFILVLSSRYTPRFLSKYHNRCRFLSTLLRLHYLPLPLTIACAF